MIMKATAIICSFLLRFIPYVCINYYWEMVLLHGPRWAYAHVLVGMAASFVKQNVYHMCFITFYL